MTQLPSSAAQSTSPDGSGRFAGNTGNVGRESIDDRLRSRLIWNALLAPLVITLAAAGAIGYLLLAESVTMAERTVVLSAAGIIAVIAILWSVERASAAAREAHGDLGELRALIPRGAQELRIFADRWQRGERPLPPEPPGRDASELRLLAYDLFRFRVDAVEAVVQAAGSSYSVAASGNTVDDQRIGVFVNLARRLQSLVQREIQLLDDLEAEVEDPELLKGLFAVDHLATRIRRHAENLAVLGGAVSHRQWSRPVNTYVVLRSAVAEVEQYARVKLVRPIDGTLKGHAVSDVIHLIAELVENATSFSNPNTQVLLRAQKVTAGIALEVEDRGLGMPREDQNRLNDMLSSPDQVDVTELLRDGRIGLYVVSTLARRHGIVVQLQTNIYGGTQAVVVLPHVLLGESDTNRTEPPRQVEQQPAPVVTPTDEHLPPRPNIPEPAAPAQLGDTPAVPASVSPAPAGDAAAPPAPAPVGGAPAPVSGAPASAVPASVSSAPAAAEPGWEASEEPPPVKRPRPYVGRGNGTGGTPMVSPDPRPTAGPSPSENNGSRPRPAPHRQPEPAAPEVTFTSVTSTGETSSRLFESENPNESTGVLDMSSLRNGSMSTPDAAGGPSKPPDAPDGVDPRPQLPQRRRQTHLVAELRDVPVRRDEPQDTEHDPGLMSAFQNGVSRAAPADEDAEVRVDGAT